MDNQVQSGVGDTMGNTLEGAPWWARSAWMVSPLVVICAFLVWVVSIRVAQQVEANAGMLVAMQQVQMSHDKQMQSRFDQLQHDASETNRILAASCVNAASTAEQRERCVGRR